MAIISFGDQPQKYLVKLDGLIRFYPKLTGLFFFFWVLSHFPTRSELIDIRKYILFSTTLYLSEVLSLVILKRQNFTEIKRVKSQSLNL